MKRCTSQSRQGMVLFPVILVLVVVTFLLGWMVLREASRAAMDAQAKAVAESAALELLRTLQAPDYADPAARGAASLARGRLAAAANGMDTRLFAPLNAGDIRVGRTWVEVTVRPRGRDGVAGQALAFGVPAGRIAAGSVRLNASGQRVATSGCLPLGVQLAALPTDGDDGGQGIWMAVGDKAAAAQCLRLSGGDPLEHVRFLSGGPEETSAGTPPPAVEIGDSVDVDDKSSGFLIELGTRLGGRTVVVPLLQGNRVIGFGRLRLDEVDAERGALRVTLAPSAVIPSAGRSGRRADLGLRRNDDQPVSAFGLALVAQTRS